MMKKKYKFSHILAAGSFVSDSTSHMVERMYLTSALTELWSLDEHVC